MKMNKLAAGALALALGLGAVAPAVAAETKSNFTGAELALERYEREVKRVNELRDAYLKEAELNAMLEKNLKDAKAELKAARDAYQALFPAFVHVTDKDGKALPLGELAKLQPEKYAEELNQLTSKKVGVDTDVKIYEAAEANKAGSGKKALVEAMDKHAKVGKNADVRDEEFNAAVDRYVNAVAEYAESIKKGSKKDLAYKKLLAAERKFDVAQQEYDDKHTDKAEGEYKGAFKDLETAARTYGFSVQVGNNGIKLVKDGEAKIKAPGAKKSQEELKAELKAAIEKNKVAVASAEFLLENAPKSVAKVKAKLEKQIKDAKAIIEKSEAALKSLEKKMALVATAYADEDVDLEALIKENEDSADAINETIKENEKEQPAVEEEKPEEKEEEKKPEENKPARKAGNNAKTGIAGVAGVAGILAAASVAYAASKRD